MSRKPRSDSKLTLDARKALRTWLVEENLSYKEANVRLEENFGITVSEGTLSRFYSEECFALRFQKSTEFADSLDLPAEQFDDKMLKALKQLAFELSLSKEPNLGALKTLFKMLGDSAKLQIAKDRVGLDARKVQLLEAKAALADEAKGLAGDAALTPEEKEQRIKQVFGIT